jgi:hypothetical protein
MTSSKTIDVERMAYSIAEFCRMFDMSRSTFYERKRQGLIRTVKEGARTLVLKSEIDRFRTVLEAQIAAGS